MLKFGNKEFRNLQEQVFKNMKDIQDIMDGTTVLAEFGIKVVGQVQLASQLPDPSTYTGQFGDAYVVGASEPYDYYIYTRAFEGDVTPQWFYLGKFPVPGPQGPQGESAGFGVVSASAQVGSVASASVTVSGPDTAKDMHFDFTIPGVDASSYVTISTDQNITGAKTFYEVPTLGTKTGNVDLQIGSTPNQIHLDTRAGSIPCIRWVNTSTNKLVTATLPTTSGILLTDTTLSGNLKTINGQTITGSGNIEINAGASEWGQITGTLSNQTDLQSALNNKANLTDIKTYTGSGNIKITDEDVITINDYPDFKEIKVNNGKAGLFVGPAGNVGSDYTSGSDYAAIRILNGTPELRNNSSTYSTSLRVNDTGIEIQKKDITTSTTVTKNLFEVADQAAQVVNKQDTISDLETIRSGAALGSTAVQPSTLSTELASKQDTLVSGTNIKTINGTSILGSGDITIQGGGGSSDIDNKTIIKNASTGKLETAIGGWKEVIVHPASQGVETGSLTYNVDNSDFDKYDTTIATNIYNLMTGSNAPDFATITCTSDIGNNFTIRLTGLKNAPYNEDYWNSDNNSFDGVDQNNNYWSVQVYVNKTADQIHVWFASQPENINSITNISFGGGPQYTETIYHKIDTNYLPEDIFDITNINEGPITDEQLEKFKNSVIVKDGENYAYKIEQTQSQIRYILNNNSSSYMDSIHVYLSNKIILIQLDSKYLNRNNNYNSYEFQIDSARLKTYTDFFGGYNLSTVLDGGYDDSEINLSTSDFTLENDHYVCNNSKFLESTKNYLAWMIKNYQSGSSLGWFKSGGNTSSTWIDMSSSEETEASSGRNIRTGTVTSAELLNSIVKIYTDTNEVISCNVIYTQAFIDFLTNNNIDIFQPDDPDRTGLIKKISTKFIPEEGYTNLAVNNQIKIGNTTLNETQLQALLNLLNK